MYINRLQTYFSGIMWFMFFFQIGPNIHWISCILAGATFQFVLLHIALPFEYNILSLSNSPVLLVFVLYYWFLIYNNSWHDIFINNASELCIVDGTKRKGVCSNWINSLGLGDEINCAIRMWVLLYIVEFPLYSIV